MEVKIKLLPGGKMPTKATDGSIGWDLYVRIHQPEMTFLEPIVVKCGFKMELPKGYEAQIRGRSGLAIGGILTHVGTIDSDYRGEVGAILYPPPEGMTFYNHQRIAQMIIQRVPDVQLIEVDELSETKRGEGGFGSSGR